MHVVDPLSYLSFFFFNDTATTEIYTLSLHDALPISGRGGTGRPAAPPATRRQREGSSSVSSRRGCRSSPRPRPMRSPRGDRKSTRLNSSHVRISYAVFCLKKKK